MNGPARQARGLLPLSLVFQFAWCYSEYVDFSASAEFTFVYRPDATTTKKIQFSHRPTSKTFDDSYSITGMTYPAKKRFVCFLLGPGRPYSDVL